MIACTHLKLVNVYDMPSGLTMDKGNRLKCDLTNDIMHVNPKVKGDAYNHMHNTASGSLSLCFLDFSIEHDTTVYIGFVFHYFVSYTML